ncbi:alpha/beta hydrolase [Paenibacillus sp. HN-1]|uniref:alpha/beta hydrolase n=1 Tax=Paenibacillus TaxID=44249 RepID=UPI001CA88CAE|nr:MULTISPECIES: alpha/beta hydrolase [Paenibacillus]MBY9081332.1 alpha/beta hydrolase [Paenibacillus sp. CGMCC 1.18879]MBY9086483.1 alpha/beta hydrolase [Paenibacillus sinensis]
MKSVNDVLPELREIMEGLPVFDLRNPQIPKGVKIPHVDKSPLVKTTKRSIPGPESELKVKIYEPVNRTNDVLPALLWIHGGGYVLGNYEIDDGLCEQFVLVANCVVVSIDYRLAPQYPYPAALEDCYAGLEWMVTQAEELYIDTSRIAIAGTSAGGGLTAALTLLARDKEGPKIAFQMPLCPMIDERNITPSSYEINKDSFPKLWNREQNQLAWSMYLGDMSSDKVPPYAAPTRSKDLSGLPPAYICVGELDLFRDETIEYVNRLAQADIPVEFHLYPGCFHGFEKVFHDTEISRQARNEYINALARALNLRKVEVSAKDR